MELLEKNHELISDGTYLAFLDFMANILPFYLEEALSKGGKMTYIPIAEKEDGVYIGKHYLGKIYYSEFISYIFGLRSFKGFKMLDPRNVSKVFLMPFDLDELSSDYYRFVQMEEYLTFSQTQTLKCESDKQECSLVELTEVAKENFIKVALKEIIEAAYNGKYNVTRVLDASGVNTITEILYLSLEIRNDELFIGEYNVGKVDVKDFIDFLTKLPCCYGKTDNPEEYELSFDLKGLIECFMSQGVTR